MIYFLLDNNKLIDEIIIKVYYILIAQHKYIIIPIRF